MSNSNQIDNALTIPTVTLCFLSSICNIYVLLFALRTQSYLRQESLILGKKSSDYTVILIIIHLVSIDFFLLIFYALNFLFPVDEDSTLCLVVGIGLQFFHTFHFLLHILFAIYFLYILRATTTKRIKYVHKRDPSSGRSRYINIAKIKFHQSYVESKEQFRKILSIMVILSVLSTIIPMFDGINSHYKLYYNYYDNKTGTNHDPGCWIEDEYQGILAFWGIISGVANIMALYVSIRKLRSRSKIAETEAYWYLVKQIFTWIMLFEIVLLFNGFSVLWYLMYSFKNTPIWVPIISHCCIAWYGVANALVWYVLHMHVYVCPVLYFSCFIIL